MKRCDKKKIVPEEKRRKEKKMNPSLDDYNKLTAFQKRQLSNSFANNDDKLRKDRLEVRAHEKKRQTVEEKMYFQQNFNREVEIKDTDYPSVQEPGETEPYEDAMTGPDDPQWGLDGRWYFWHRYNGTSEARSLKSLFEQ
jgi:hypothetical protein